MLGVSSVDPYVGLYPAYSYLQSLGAPDLSNLTELSKLAFVIQLGAPYKTLFQVSPPGGEFLSLNVTLFGLLSNFCQRNVSLSVSLIYL